MKVPCSSLTVILDAFICCINLESGTITCGAVATKIEEKKRIKGPFTNKGTELQECYKMSKPFS